MHTHHIGRSTIQTPEADRAQAFAEGMRATRASGKIAAPRTVIGGSDTVEVCPICDIAGCRHIRERQYRQAVDDLNRKSDADLTGNSRNPAPEGPHGVCCGEHSGLCRKCGGLMLPGIATAQTYTMGTSDFPGDDYASTMSAGGPGVITSCRKCSDCGWSVTGPAPEPGAGSTGDASGPVTRTAPCEDKSCGADVYLTEVKAGLIAAEKIAARIAGDHKTWNADRRRGAGEVQAAIRAALAQAQTGGVWRDAHVNRPPEDAEVLCFWGDHCATQVGIWNGASWQDANGAMKDFDADPAYWMGIPALTATAKGEV